MSPRSLHDAAKSLTRMSVNRLLTGHVTLRIVPFTLMPPPIALGCTRLGELRRC